MKNTIKIYTLVLTALLMFVSIISKTSSAQETGGTITDIEGNQYRTVIIGEPEWMGENLKVTRFNDGKDIPDVPEMDEWTRVTGPAYSWYDNDISNKDIYGALYNWWAVGSREDLCPAGWRVATEDDWQTLERYIGMSPEQIQGTAMRGNNEGGKLKEAGTQNWVSPNEGATNEFDFTVVPGGRRESDGRFLGLNSGGTIWTSTETSFSCAYYRHFATGSAQIGRNPNGEKKFGLSVRCIKNK